MPLTKGKSKPVISRNIKEFHTGKTYAKTAAKFGKKDADRQAIAVALSAARKSGGKYADGGEVMPFFNTDLRPSHEDPTKLPWKGSPAEIYNSYRNDPQFGLSHDKAVDATQRFMQRMYKDNPDWAHEFVAQPKMGEDMMARGGRSYADGGDVGDVDWSKMNQPFGEIKSNSPQDTPVFAKTASPYATIHEGDIDQGMNVGMGAGPGIMVGPYGALALRNAARETGNVAAERAQVHPVVGKEIQREVESMHPDLRDAYRNGIQAQRDEWARGVLEQRAAAGDFRDRDVFAKSGWSFTADGQPAKEIPDLGVKVHHAVPDENGNPVGNYTFDHPAGDFHKIYEIPPIKEDPTAKVMGARAFFDYPMNEGRGPIKIGVGSDPTKSVSPVLHEVQHAVAYREGWPSGSAPINTPAETVNREHFPGFAMPEYQKQALMKAEPGLKVPDNVPSTEKAARLSAYLHSAGENQAFNTQNTRRQAYEYLIYPADRDPVPRAFQDIEYFHPTHKPKKYADGGGVGNFNPERGAAFGLARQGMIKSTVPGRTDKLNLNVPSGSYIIPADIPSAIGQGNSDAGSAILNKMFNKGPYGMSLPRTKSSSPKGPRAVKLSMKFADGGKTGQATPIVAAGGEYVIHPDTIAALGNGNINLGHEILDAFVKHIRAKHITTLKGLKPPKGSSK